MKRETLGDPNKALVELDSLDRVALAQRWAEVFGHPAPLRAHAQLLRSALAWRYQVDHEASVEVDRLLRRLRKQADIPVPAVLLSPGTRLLREWQGVTYHVTVTADGFQYGGKHYRSLTAITREITGISWSGPSFFGVSK